MKGGPLVWQSSDYKHSIEWHYYEFFTVSYDVSHSGTEKRCSPDCLNFRYLVCVALYLHQMKNWAPKLSRRYPHTVSWTNVFQKKVTICMLYQAWVHSNPRRPQWMRWILFDRVLCRPVLFHSMAIRSIYHRQTRICTQMYRQFDWRASFSSIWSTLLTQQNNWLLRNSVWMLWHSLYSTNYNWLGDEKWRISTPKHDSSLSLCVVRMIATHWLTVWCLYPDYIPFYVQFFKRHIS